MEPCDTYEIRKCCLICAEVELDDYRNDGNAAYCTFHKTDNPDEHDCDQFRLRSFDYTPKHHTAKACDA